MKHYFKIVPSLNLLVRYHLLHSIQPLKHAFKIYNFIHDKLEASDNTLILLKTPNKRFKDEWCQIDQFCSFQLKPD